MESTTKNKNNKSKLSPLYSSLCISARNIHSKELMQGAEWETGGIKSQILLSCVHFKIAAVFDVVYVGDQRE